MCVKRALGDVINYGFDDVVKRPLFHPHFEWEMLKRDDRLRDTIRKKAFSAFNQNRIQDMGFSPIDWFYIPKAKYLQRKCAYIEPEDVVKYLSLVLAIAEKIESNRISRQKLIVHSYRYNASGVPIFSKSYNYSTFRKRSKELSKQSKFDRKIITDISEFYDRINLHRVESQLLSIGCDPTVVAKINELLMTWSGRDSYGLPVGGNASRILAEAALIDIDRYLVSQNIPYIRFVDDFRIFAKSNDQAAYFLQIIQARLAEDGLTLNSEKTSVVSAHEEEVNDLRMHKSKSQLDSERPVESSDEEKEARLTGFDVYKGKLPLAYRKPSDEKEEDLRKIDINKQIEEINLDISVEIENVKNTIRAIIIQNREDAGVVIHELVKQYIELMPYAVDAILSTDNLLTSTKNDISRLFGKWLIDDSQKPDYVVSSLVRLIMHISADGKFVVSRFLESLRRDGSSVVGREIFLSLLPEIERSDLLRFKKLYWRATQSERRALIKGFIANKTVHDREKEPWLKTVRSINQDPFIEYMISNKSRR